MRNYIANKLLYIVDFACSFAIVKKNGPIPKEPKSFLISNLAHLGDVLLMTSFLSILKQNFPDAKVGVIIGSWSLPIVDKNPCIDKIHIVDHWKLNRSPISRLQKIKQYYKTKKLAISEIRKANYDVAIDLYFFFPNSLPILWQSNIPIRIGYSSGGFGPLLTHAFKWTNLNQPIAHYCNPFLNLLGINTLDEFKPHLHISTKKKGVECLQEKVNCDFSNGYIVIHIGTGLPIKEWQIEKWQDLANRLEGYPLVFTGRGKEEKSKVDRIISQKDNCFNLVDLLKWDEYLSVIQDAKLLIGVDSLAGHLAAALDVPAVLIFAGITNPHHWAPMSKKNKIVTHNMPCSPCFKSNGCPEMSCIREVKVDRVFEACKAVLHSIPHHLALH